MEPHRRGSSHQWDGMIDVTHVDDGQRHRGDRRSGSSGAGGSTEGRARAAAAARAQLLALGARRHVLGPHLQELRQKQDQNGTP